MKRAWPIAVLVADVGRGRSVRRVTRVRLRVTGGPSSRARHDRLAPYLTWSDVTPTSTPNLWRMAEKGASVPSTPGVACAKPGEPASPIEGALGLSAGAWAQPDFRRWRPTTRPRPSKASETASAVYAVSSVTAWTVRRSAIWDCRRRSGSTTRTSSGAVLGTLGQAVRDANGLTAAVGQLRRRGWRAVCRGGCVLRRSQRWMSRGWCATATSRPTLLTNACPMRRTASRPTWRGSSGYSAVLDAYAKGHRGTVARRPRSRATPRGRGASRRRSRPEVQLRSGAARSRHA